MRQIIVAIIFVAFLSACTTAQQEPTATPNPTSMSVLATFTPLPSTTLRPSPTSTITETPSPTPTPLGGGGHISFSLYSIVENGYSLSSFIMNPDGSNIEQIYDHNGIPDETYYGWDRPGKFSPDGIYLAIEASDYTENSSGEVIRENLKIVIINILTGEIITFETTQPWVKFGWSPSGEYFYFSEGVISTTEWDNLLQFPEYIIYGMANDNTLIVLPADHSGGYQFIDLEGNILNEFPGYHYACEYLDPSAEWCYALVKEHGDDIGLVSTTIYKWYFDDMEPEVILELEASMEASFLPEKDLLVYNYCPLATRSSDGSCNLGLIDLNTGENIPVPNDTNSAFTPVFSPDGQYILYLEIVPRAEPGTVQSWLRLLDWQTGVEIEITVDLGIDFVGPPAWGP